MTRDECKATLAETLPAARRMRGLTQVELASSAGLPQSAISMIERGETVPGMDTVENLLVALDLTYEQLVGREALPAQKRRKRSVTVA